MPQEIEQKLLVGGEYKSQAYVQSRVTQDCISSARGRAVRVRTRDGRGYLTIEGASDSLGISRYEWEKEIPLNEAEDLMRLYEPSIIGKVRYLVRSGQYVFGMDKLYGGDEGLTVAEVELASKNEPFEKPDSIGRGVTGDIHYYNLQLMKHPFKGWE